MTTTKKWAVFVKHLLTVFAFFMLLLSISFVHSGNYISIVHIFVSLFFIQILYAARECEYINNGIVCDIGLFKTSNIDLHESDKILIKHPAFGPELNHIVLFHGSYFNRKILTESDGKIGNYVKENAVKTYPAIVGTIYWLPERDLDDGCVVSTDQKKRTIPDNAPGILESFFMLFT